MAPSSTFAFCIIVLSCTSLALACLRRTMEAQPAGNPCCSFPCQNNGVCMTTGHEGYVCDCSNLDFYGKHCETPTLWKRFVLAIKPSPDTIHHLLTHYKPVWKVVNRITFLKSAIMRRVYLLRDSVVDTPSVYTSGHSYPTAEAFYNISYFKRSLPPVPEDCPTPLGVVGGKQLPDVNELTKLFVRKTFKPDPLRTSVLFAFFAQHFTHQFFKTDFKKGSDFTWSRGHGVDVSNIYGPDVATENQLRSFKNGKLKTQVINGEEWPPRLSDAPVKMVYPPSVPKEKHFALGHELFGLVPGLFVMGTIWLREHNRVCEVLHREHPEWKDEQIFQTAKLILTGETIAIVIKDYVQHLSHYNFDLLFDPELLFGQPFQYHNRISLEFNHLYHWHPMMPDTFNISGHAYPIRKTMFNMDSALKHGMNQMVDSYSKQIAGQVTHENHPAETLNVVRQTILHERQLRFQSFNQYRRRFNLKPYTSFQELTGETEMAARLEALYGDIESLEFFVGLIMEKARPNAMFGSTTIEVGGAFSVRGLLSNPICSPRHWKPSTFGGEIGFNIIKTASLKNLFCLNLKGKCPTVAFEVPQDIDTAHYGTEGTKQEL